MSCIINLLHIIYRRVNDLFPLTFSVIYWKTKLKLTFLIYLLRHASSIEVHLHGMQGHAYVVIKSFLQILILVCSIHYVDYWNYQKTTMSKSDFPVIFVTHGA